MSEKKSTFWTELARRLQGRSSEATLARQLGVSPQTLASWKARGQFRRSLLAKLSEIFKDWQVKDWQVTEKQATRMGVTLIDDPPLLATVELHPLEVALRQADREYRQTARSFARYSQMTMQLLRAIGKGCFFAFSACTTSPYEFEDTDEGRLLANEIAGAVQRGALCLYIRPTKAGIEYYERGWGYGRLVQHNEAVKEFARFRERVVEMLVKGMAGGDDIPAGVAGGKKYSRREAERLVYEQLDQCYITRSPMWMPGIGLGMVGRADARDLTTRVTISLPGGKFGGILVYPAYAALEYRFTQVLHSVVTNAFAEVKRILIGADRGSPQHVQLDQLSVEHLPEIEVFYTSFDQRLRTVSSRDPGPNALDLIENSDGVPAPQSSDSDPESYDEQ